MGDEIQPLVLDNGSGSLKIGFAGDDLPKSEFLSVIGRPLTYPISGAPPQKDSYIGQEAQQRRGILSISYPIHRGTVVNWDDMEQLWHHAFYGLLKVAPEEHPLLISEIPFTPKANKEKTEQLMFETFNVPAFYSALGGFLCVYSSGRGSALVLDIGEGACYAMNVVEGYSFPTATSRWDFGGWDLTRYLARLLKSSGHSFQSTAEMEIVREIKEKNSYVSLDFERDLRHPQVKAHKLPDGHIIRLGQELFSSSEALFRPSLVGSDALGVPEFLFRAVSEVELDWRKVLLGNVVLSGGTTLLPGFPGRLQREIENLAPSACQVRVIAPKERKYAVWIGGSILASLSSFQQMWMSKEEYDESGPGIIRKPCW